jgi:glycolate oxidase
MFEALRGALAAPDSLIEELSGFSNYFHDATQHTAEPAALLIAESVDDIIIAVRHCRDYGIPITTRGAGTGLSGGCVASPGALLLSTERLDDIDVDPFHRIALCGPGVITKDLQDLAATFGLTYPPDPASYTESTLGGNVAEGAGGLRCKKYGVTKDYVIGLEAVTAAAETVQTGYFSGQRGLNFGDVFIASEGTLGIITRIAVRLTPTPPRGITILAGFDSMAGAARTVSEITAAGIVPAVLEFVDGDAIACVNSYTPTKGLDQAEALLLIETGGEQSASEKTAIESICKRNRASLLRTEADPEKAESLWKIRRTVSTAVRAISRYAVSEDVVVPISRFPDLVGFVAEMNAASSLRINSFGHAGDGNLHVYFISADASPADLTRIDEGIACLMHKTLALGGTITGEHGVGLAKRQFLQDEFDAPTLAAMKKFKDIFDPNHLLNPDKLFPRDGN